MSVAGPIETLKAALEAIPHVAMEDPAGAPQHRIMTGWSVGAGIDAAQLAATILTVNGWGAGLHAQRMVWAIDVLADDPLGPLAVDISLQRHRATVAAALGIDAPLTAGPGMAMLCVGHMATDRTLLAMAMRHTHDVLGHATEDEVDHADPDHATPERLQIILSPMNVTVYARFMPTNGRTAQGRGAAGNSFAAIEDADHAPFLRSEIRRGGWSFDGRVVRVPSDVASIPETVALTAVGRRVGEILSTGTDLDRRVVVSARMEVTGLEIGVEPDMVRFADLPETRVDLAAIAALPSIS